jgi:hypothetical protein
MDRKSEGLFDCAKLPRNGGEANVADIHFALSMRFLQTREENLGNFFLAARLGVEPRQNESESFVLPLHHRAVTKKIAGSALNIAEFFPRIPPAAPSKLEPAMGFEPATACLQNRCSTVELRRRGALRASEQSDWKKTNLVAPPRLELGTN